EDYVSKFTTYLKRVRPLSTGLSSMAAELDVAKSQQQNKDADNNGNKTKPKCPCGLKHYWVDCWLINTEHPRRPKAYANALGRKKLDAALAADNDLRDKINKALDKWRAKQQQSEGSIAIDDGNRPTRPTANTVRYIIQDQEQSALEDNKITQNERVKKMTTCDNRVETNTIADDGLKPKDNLYTAVSMEEDIDKLKEFEPDDMAIEDLLTARQRRQQPTDAPALSESQVGGEEMEHYNGGLLTPEPSNLSLYNDQDLISEQRAMDEQLAQEQQRNVTISLKVHAVHEETLISRNQRDGTLMLSHMEVQLTTTLKLSQLP
ncbi:hypothetical protein Ptr902_13591, partial [Pyrenophora tritici-repentis]